MQTPSWQDISNNYTTEDEDRPQESKAVVCDINKEMLKVGKQKADSTGISAGEFSTVKLLQVSWKKETGSLYFPSTRRFQWACLHVDRSVFWGILLM